MSSYNSFGGEPRFPYAVDADGTVDLTAAIGQVSLAPLVRAVNRGDRPAADAALAALGAEGSSAPILEAARVLLGTMDFKPGPAPSLAEGRVCLLSEAAAAESSVGYGRAVANRLPGDDALLLAGGRLHARGLYAHAPARHRWALDGKWERLTGIAALADGREGSVAMRILADGQQIWKSPRLADGATARFDLPVKGVASLELLADDAGDGNRSDWALWLDPTLHRQGSD